MSGAVNEQTCEAKHDGVSGWIRRVEAKADRALEGLEGNGKPGVKAELTELKNWRDAVEKTHLRNETLFWRVIGPAIPYLWATVMGLIAAKTLVGK